MLRKLWCREATADSIHCVHTRHQVILLSTRNYRKERLLLAASKAAGPENDRQVSGRRGTFSPPITGGNCRSHKRYRNCEQANYFRFTVTSGSTFEEATHVDAPRKYLVHRKYHVLESCSMLSVFIFFGKTLHINGCEGEVTAFMFGSYQSLGNISGIILLLEPETGNKVSTMYKIYSTAQLYQTCFLIS